MSILGNDYLSQGMYLIFIKLHPINKNISEIKINSFVSDKHMWQ